MPMSQRQSRKPRRPRQITREQQIARQDQKENILAAAGQLFSNRGFRRTTLDQVAACVELTKPRLYFHFKNKREILRECIEQALRQWTALISELEADRPSSGEQAVSSIVERYADVAFGRFGMCLMRGDLEYLDAAQREALISRKTNIDDRLKGLISTRTHSSSDPEFLWLMVAVLVHGIAMSERPVAEKRKTFSKALKIVIAGSKAR